MSRDWMTRGVDMDTFLTEQTALAARIVGGVRSVRVLQRRR